MKQVKQGLQKLLIFLCWTLLILATGCVQVKVIAGAPNDHLLLLKDSESQVTRLLDCQKSQQDPPELNCQTYSIHEN